MTRRRRLCLAAALLVASAAGAAEPAEPGIQDNSFLLEEAYNQDPRVVQHIQTFERLRGGDWVYTFTQEWPLGGLRNQGSFTLPVVRTESSGHGGKIGDIALNYRYQLVGGGESAVACAPRLSILLPTGSAREGTGAGSASAQFDFPMSVVLSPAFVAHTNAGVTYTPSARNAAGERADTTAYNFGQSVVWLARPRFNVLLEALWTGAERVAGPRRREPADSFFVSPGIRWAYNFKSGLQIVPGIAVPMGVGPSRGERAVFLYLSFEHPY